MDLSKIKTGVWTSTSIPRNLKFGPYKDELKFFEKACDNRETAFMLEVCKTEWCVLKIIIELIFKYSM